MKLQKNVPLEKRKRAAEYVKQWRKENTYKVIQNRIQNAIDNASRSGMQDKEILIEAKKAIRRAKRRKASDSIPSVLNQ